MAEFDPLQILRTLVAHEVRFVLIGGVAARLRGAPLLTEDLDIAPEAADDNLQRLVVALEDLEARLRTVSDPDGVPFPLDATMLAGGESWTLVTRAGDLDLHFAPSGTGGYPDLIRGAAALAVDEEGLTVVVASLEDVIRSKEAAGRDKDRAALPLLRRTLAEIDRDQENSAT